MQLLLFALIAGGLILVGGAIRVATRN
jgi:hypothetical protein